MKFWGTPAGAALIVGLVLAILSLFGAIPDTLALPIGFGVVVGFAFWLSRWVRYRTFAPGIWLGLMLTFWVPVLHTLLLPVYLTHHPGSLEVGRGVFFLVNLVGAVFYAIALATLASLFAIGPRRRDQARMRARDPARPA